MVAVKEALISLKNEYRPLVAFCWNEELDHERLAEQIDWFREAGYGGFMIVRLSKRL